MAKRLENESELIALAQAGNEPAHLKIIEHYLPEAKRLCRKLALEKGFDESEGESAAYDAILKAIETYKFGKKSSRNKTGTTASFKTWLSHTARGVVTKMHREWRRQTGGASGIKPPSADIESSGGDRTLRADEIFRRVSDCRAPGATAHEELLPQACIAERDKRAQRAKTDKLVSRYLGAGGQIQRLRPGKPLRDSRYKDRSTSYKDPDPHWPPKPPKISEKQRQERRIYEGIVFLIGAAQFYSWFKRRKGVDRDDQKLARMLWTEYKREDGPENIGGYWRPLTRAEAAAELGWDRAKVDRRVARIVKELTGKTEAEILRTRHGLGPFFGNVERKS